MNVDGALADLNAIVAPDGARLVVVRAEGGRVDLRLDLSRSECPECVVPRAMLVDVLRSRLEGQGPDPVEITLDDPREHPGYEPGAHP